MDLTVIGQLTALRQMTVPELRQEWARLYGEPARSSNRAYMWKRLAWRIQELAHGGLSDATRVRLEELAPDVPIAALHGPFSSTRCGSAPGCDQLCHICLLGKPNQPHVLGVVRMF